MGAGTEARECESRSDKEAPASARGFDDIRLKLLEVHVEDVGIGMVYSKHGEYQYTLKFLRFYQRRGVRSQETGSIDGLLLEAADAPGYVVGLVAPVARPSRIRNR